MIGEERPTTAFLGAITEALAGGRAWLADRSTGKGAAGEEAPGSEKLGWTDSEGIYLIPGTAYRFASVKLDYRGGIHISERALHRLLDEEGHLVRDPSEPDRLTPNRWCEGGTVRVLWLKPGSLGDLPKPKSRETHCWSCKAELSTEVNSRCTTCGWLACSCGACGCSVREGKGR